VLLATGDTRNLAEVSVNAVIDVAVHLLRLVEVWLRLSHLLVVGLLGLDRAGRVPVELLVAFSFINDLVRDSAGVISKIGLCCLVDVKCILRLGGRAEPVALTDGVSDLVVLLSEAGRVVNLGAWGLSVL